MANGRKNLTQKRMNGLTPYELEQLRRLLKNKKEKDRRRQLNEQIAKIAKLLGLDKNSGLDKVEILSKAADNLRNLLKTSSIS